MNTITTKQLRENMPEVIRDLREGKFVRLSYRHKIIGTLRPAHGSATPSRRGSGAAIADFLDSADFGPIPARLRNSKLSTKQQLAQLRNRR